MKDQDRGRYVILAQVDRLWFVLVNDAGRQTYITEDAALAEVERLMGMARRKYNALKVVDTR